MAYGFTVYNANNGRPQVEQDYVNPRLLLAGSWDPIVRSGAQTMSTGHITVQLPYNLEEETPLVFIRPKALGGWVGGLSWVGVGRQGLDQNYFNVACPNGAVVLHGNVGFDYALYTSRGNSVSDGSVYGLEVYTAEGRIAYSSRFKYPRITNFFHKPADSSNSGGYPQVCNYSGYTEMPWLFANPLRTTNAGVGEYTESAGSVMACVNNYNSFTVDLRDGADLFPNNDPSQWFPTLPNLDRRWEFNPYLGFPAYWGVAKLET